MKIARSLLLGVAGILLTVPQESYAASKKVIIGFHRKPELHEHNLVYGAKGRVRRAHRQIPAISAELPEEEVARLRKDPSVAYVVDDVPVKPIESVQTLSVSSPEYADSWGVQRIGAETAAARGFRGAGVKVAIIDSGIDYDHPDLKDNYRGGYNFLDNNSDPYDEAQNSHGTHVAGIIAARDNGTGVVGVAPEASLYAVKIFGANGAGGELSSVIAALEWAIDNGMNVVNLSLGIDSQMVELLPDTYRPLIDVCDRAYNAGIVLVAAVGNEGRDRVSAPAAFDSVIAVSATDQSDQRAVFERLSSSNFGAAVELAAPGKDIKSTVRGGGYALLNGTSQAAPHVAGAAAVLLSSGITDTNGNGSKVDEVRQRLAETAKDLGDQGRDNLFGWGLVDLASATAASDTKTLHVARTDGAPRKDAVSLVLQQGVYSVKVKNNGLRGVIAVTSDLVGRELEQVFSHVFRKRSPQEASFELKVEDSEEKLTFLPYGDFGATADITITRLSRTTEGGTQ